MKNSSLILVNQCRDEIFVFVQPDSKNKGSQYLHMRFDKSDTATAIYHAIKKAASLKYDFGYPSVKIEINGVASTEMSYVVSTKLYIK